MDSTGYIYVPSKCQLLASECKQLLLFFHGCLGGREYVGPNVILEAGFPEELEARGIVGVFPQIKRSQDRNPFGCWNYLGYLPQDPEYYARPGVQIQILRNMIQSMMV